MKRISAYIIALLSLVLFCTTAQGANTITQIKKIREIIQGCVYLITKPTSSNYYYFIFQNRYNRDTFSAYISDNKYNSTKDDVIKNSNLVKIYKNRDGKWCMYDIKTKKYVGVIDATSYKYLSEMDNLQDDYSAGFIQINGIDMPSYYFRPNSSSSDYGITIDDSNEYGVTIKSGITDKNIVRYYRIEDYGFYLDEDTDFPIGEPRIDTSLTDLPTTATLNITLSNEYYNTLMLPCAVSDYKTVFGESAKAYEVGEVSTEQIFFKPVEGNSLEANKPYILTGTFNEGPYKLTNVVIDTKNISNGIMTCNVNGDTFNGVYSSGIDLKNSESFILYNNKFYSCKNQDSMPIRLFRWYYQSATKSGKHIVIDNNLTEIKTIENSKDVKDDDRFFKLDGTCAGTEYESLPKGIYINNGKKIIK